MLNLADLNIGLDDLLTKRHAALISSKVGAGQEDLLKFQQSAIDALPRALTSKRPLAEELSVTDAEHDGFGSGIWHLTEAYQRIANLDAKVADAVRRIRAAFIPEINELQASYADQASAAADRKPELKALEEDLKLIPIAGGGTLLDWATSFLKAGDKISTLLSERADIDGKSRKKATSLRSETVGILNDLRTAVAREVRMRPDLPADLDAQIFSYFDTLEDQREDANRAAKAAAKDPKGKPEGRPEGKPEAKPEGKPEAKLEAKPEAKLEAKPEARLEAKPVEAKPEAKPEAKAEAEGKLETKPAAKPDAALEAKPDAAPNAKPDTGAAKPS